MTLNSSRVYLDRFVRQAARSVAIDGRVLDAGAGMTPYRHHFKRHVYESADFRRVDKPYAEDISYVCDLAAVPVESSAFDLIVLTQGARRRSSRLAQPPSRTRS